MCILLDECCERIFPLLFLPCFQVFHPWHCIFDAEITFVVPQANVTQ
jgi:hypothetical protein